MLRRFTSAIIALALSLSLACASGSVFQKENDSPVPDTVLQGFTLTPSPARDSLLIRYQLLQNVQSVKLHLYDVTGDFVRVLDRLPTQITGGVINAWTWDLKDFEGRRVPVGSYLARLRVESAENTWRLTRTIVVN